MEVEILILGLGWSGAFLQTLLKSHAITFAATTTAGRDGTIPFKFDPSSEDPEPYKALPPAKTIMISFPLKGEGQSRLLTKLYAETHSSPGKEQATWIQLGSTGIFKGKGWNDEGTSYDKENPRAIAEDELMSYANGIVLNLAGLYGGTRVPKNWLLRVAKDKESLKAKEALHLVHGDDVARAVMLSHRQKEKLVGKRWIVMDLHVYDWWDLALAWGREVREGAGRAGDEGAEKLEFERWVRELMVEQGVRALPREAGTLGRVIDGRAFWKQVGGFPVRNNVLWETSESSGAV